ncbi:MAG: DNA polymerase III subunit gamma/tau [Trueperaceae bacterium]|nr:DNA polymerase III subunit gamma/tau [Trueperaceae bacterium]
MSALYQRARPVTFDEVVGQDHVKDVLTAAIRRRRVGHAYLFSGPRGVGKTTSARLLAMAVNCEAGEGERPCGVCESCRLVQAGSHPDVIEMDAASNNSVDDVRELRERTMLSSIRGGTRVWILDEAHMLSKAAANALLKTLEEPPPSLLFVLATTEPERLPPTVLSRCQHFRFRRLTDGEIVGKLARLSAAAGVAAETAALQLVARSADGGMRDAESLLDRLLAGGESITLQRAEDALGLPPHERLRAMAEALAEGDLQGLLEQASGLYRAGFAPRTLAEQLARTLRDALHARLAGTPWLELAEDDLLRLLHALDDEQERFVRHDDLYSLEVALIKARNALRGNVPAAFAARTASDEQPTLSGRGAVPQAHAPEDTAARSVAARAARAPEEPAPGDQTLDGRTPDGRTPDGRTPDERAPDERAPDERAPTDDARAAAPAGPRRTAEPTAAADARPRQPERTQGEASFSWHAVRSKADVRLKAFLAPARVEIVGRTIRIAYPDTNEFHHKQLLMRLEELRALVTDVAGAAFEIEVDGPGGGPKKV